MYHATNNFASLVCHILIVESLPHGNCKIRIYTYRNPSHHFPAFGRITIANTGKCKLMENHQGAFYKYFIFVNLKCIIKCQWLFFDDEHKVSSRQVCRVPEATYSMFVTRRYLYILTYQIIF